MVKEHNETPINISLAIIMVVAIFFAFYMAHNFQQIKKTNVEINQTSKKNKKWNIKNQVILIPKILTYLKAVLMMYLKVK
jgi:flagellar motor component MotA